MRNIFILSIAVVLISTGCSKLIVPNYTTVKEIHGLKKGMTMENVNSTLGVLPNEFYTNFSDGNKVLVYKYKKQYQLVPLKSQNDKEYLANGGKEKFIKENNLYVVFDQKTDKMAYFITDIGRETAKKRIAESNLLKLIKADPIKFDSHSKADKNSKKSILSVFKFN